MLEQQEINLTVEHYYTKSFCSNYPHEIFAFVTRCYTKDPRPYRNINNTMRAIPA